MRPYTLYINACVRADSRTAHLAEKLLSKMDQPIDEIRVHEIPFPVADEDFLIMREELIAEKNFENPLFDLARQFAEAEEIVYTLFGEDDPEIKMISRKNPVDYL